jgi:transcriptional regulator with XRE-family HTH domain
MKTLQDMGREVARLRKERNLTQQQLGDLVGMGQSTIARFESGRVPEFGASKLLRVLAALGHELVSAPLVIQETLPAADDAEPEVREPEAPAKPRGRGRPPGSGRKRAAEAVVRDSATSRSGLARPGSEPQSLEASG